MAQLRQRLATVVAQPQAQQAEPVETVLAQALMPHGVPGAEVALLLPVAQQQDTVATVAQAALEFLGRTVPTTVAEAAAATTPLALAVQVVLVAEALEVVRPRATTAQQTPAGVRAETVVLLTLRQLLRPVVLASSSSDTWVRSAAQEVRIRHPAGTRTTRSQQRVTL